MIVVLPEQLSMNNMIFRFLAVISLSIATSTSWRMLIVTHALVFAKYWTGRDFTPLKQRGFLYFPTTISLRLSVPVYIRMNCKKYK